VRRIVRGCWTAEGVVIEGQFWILGSGLCFEMYREVGVVVSRGKVFISRFVAVQITVHCNARCAGGAPSDGGKPDWNSV
jgi:hypothetical protein